MTEDIAPKKEKKSSYKTARYFFLTVALAIPFFLTVLFYIETVMERDDEKMALFLTIYFFGGIFTGRFLSQLWITQHKNIPVSVYKLLGAVIIICTITILIGIQFSLWIKNLFLGVLFLGFPLLFFSVAIGMLVKLIRTTIKNQLEEAKVEAAQSQTELKLLQSQLSPHFLFNTLNNIYGISLSQHEKVPGLLLKLSSLLRYSVYDVKEFFVPLKNELSYIRDYIDFEKIRIGDKLQLNFYVEENMNPSLKIAPLLLIVFIENAFKHSKNTTEEKIFIDIAIRTWGNTILFSVKNSSRGEKQESGILNAGSGFGLANVSKRLELLYDKHYDLEVEHIDGYYSVLLQLKAR